MLKILIHDEEDWELLKTIIMEIGDREWR